MSTEDLPVTSSPTATADGGLDVERDSDVPISTQIYWQLAYQIDSGRLLPGARLPPVRELAVGSASRNRHCARLSHWLRIGGGLSCHSASETPVW
jgi:hypothetical protein